MSAAQIDELTPPRPLRLWPGVAAVALQWVIRFGVPVVFPDALAFAVIGGLACALVVVVWWLLFSRARWFDRVGAIALMVAAEFATPRLLDVSIATGMMGLMFTIYSIPVLCLAFVLALALTRSLPGGLRRTAVAATILLASGVWALLRTDGMTSAGAQLAWRWSKTPEQRLLAQAEEKQTPATKAALAAPQGADWPGFRGRDRDSVVRGVRIGTNWSESPPVQMWRRPVGPGWSSFAVRGNLFYTQEQRGDEEDVACQELATGAPVWRHSDAVRFWESNAGAGPRGTPTLSNGRVYTFGATGILNALDATNGAVVWTRNVAADTETKVPKWGFSSSPLVANDIVIVAASGKLAAYDLATGKSRWFGPVRGGSYSSPHWASIDGVAQVLLLNDAGAISIAPASGALLWEQSWRGFSIIQPALTADGDVLASTSDGGGGGGTGVHRLAIAHGAGGWTVQERWKSIGLKPYFNDFVVHKGHAFGFDNSLLSCIDLQDGKRVWKGGRYGNGQLVLLADQDLLLIVSETGELALVAATPDDFKELARFRAIEGKTWNHPALAGDVLLVRNSQEMAAFRMPPASR